MDLYTVVSDGLYYDKVIDEYESCIWTERHVDPGEVQLVIPATVENYSMLAPSTLLAHPDSRELMLLDTRSVKEGMLTASGKSFETWLDQRYNDAFDAIDTPAGIMGQIVQNMLDRYAVLDAHGPAGEYPYLTMDLSYLIQVGYLEPGDGSVVEEKVEAGPTYTNLMKIAQKYHMQFGLYRVSTDGGGFELHFRVDMGKDRTRNQTANKLVTFSPGLDSLADPEDLTSDVGYKNVVLAWAPADMEIDMGKFSITPDPVKVSRVPNGYDEYQPIKERVLEIHCDDLKIKDLGPEGTSGDDQLTRLYEILEDRARRKLRKQQRTDMVSGEITPDSQYKYKGDNSDPATTTFDLGDRVEFGGHFGEIREGTVTEFVRSSDSSGSRQFPGVSEKATPVLQTQSSEQVISWSYAGDGWNPEGTGFWSDSDLTIAKPMFFEADQGTILLPGDGFVSQIGPAATKIRYRWGDDPDHSHYLEWDVPEPPAGASDLRAYVWGHTDDNGIDNYVGFRLDTNAGEYYLWVWDGDEGFWYLEPEGDQDYYETYSVIRPEGWAGWHATTRIIPTGIAIV